MSEVTNLAATTNGDTVVLDVYSMLWTVPAAGGEAQSITEPSLEATRPRMSPDGELIAFQAYRGGHYQIWVVRTDGSELRQLTDGRYDHREPSWSPDGTAILFSSERAEEGSLDIWSVDVASEELTRLTTDPAEEYEPAWSPDGSQIALVEGAGRDSRVVAHDITTDVRREIAVGGRTPSWTPDGESVIYWQDGNLVADGAPLTEDEDVFTFPVSWASEDTYLYTADGRVWHRDLAGGDRTEVPFSAIVERQRPLWEPADRGWSSTDDRPVRGIVNPRHSPDGETIVFGALGDVFLLNEGTTERLTDDEYWAYDFEWARDGASFTYTSDKAGSPDVYRYEVASGQEERLTSAPGAEYGASLSPDGGRLAYLDDDNDLFVLDLETDEITEFGDSPAGELWEGTSWSPDGRYVALGDGAFALNTRFRENYNSIWIIDTVTGERTPHRVGDRASIADRGDSGPVWSPDGQWMAFIRESNLWVIPVDGSGAPTGDARQVTTETADSPSWNGESSRLLYLHHGQLRSVALDGSDQRDHPLDLEWRPDVPTDRTIVHAGRMWDGMSDSALDDVDIIIDADRITAVVPHDPAMHGEAHVIDASDQTVMPGMFEMHSHPQDMRFYASKWWSIYYSMGFSSVVSMGGFLNEAVATREALASGNLLGARPFVAGELIDGDRVSHPEQRAILDDAQLERELDRHRALAPDLYKTYVRTSPDHMARVAEVAHAQGVPVFSHILASTATLGLDGTSHLGATQRAGYNNVTSPAGVSYQDVVDIYSLGEVDLIATPFPASSLLGLQPELAEDPRVQRLLPPGDVERVERATSQAPTPEQLDSLAASTEIYARIVQAGGNVGAGTDAPLAIPAVHNHMVLRALVHGGMTQAEALRTATSSAAEIMGVSADLGSVEAGKIADLVFVDGDPLADIDDLINVAAMMKGGKFSTQEEILAAFPGAPGPDPGPDPGNGEEEPTTTPPGGEETPTETTPPGNGDSAPPGDETQPPADAVEAGGDLATTGVNVWMMVIIAGLAALLGTAFVLHRRAMRMK